MITGTQLPYITPIITFFLGLIAVPITEHFKAYLEKRRILKALIVELHDEVLIIDHEFEMLYECFEDIKSVQETKNGFSKLNTVSPDQLKIYSISKILDNHFEKLNTVTRRSIKHINETGAHLNNLSIEINSQYKEYLPDILKDDNQVNKLLTNQCNYLCCILYYRYNIIFLLKILSNESTDLKIFSELKFYDVVKHQLHELDKNEYVKTLINFQKPYF